MSQIWAHTDLPISVWALLVVLSLLVALWSVSRVSLEKPRRRCIAACRFGVLLTVLAIVAQLHWAHPEEQVDPDVVQILVDRSGSMNVIEDGLQRDAQLRYSVDTIAAAALAQSPHQHSRPKLVHRLGQSPKSPRRVQWFGFNHTPTLLPLGPEGRPQLPPASGGPSNIGTAVEAALADLQGAPLAGVVILTDGRGPLDAARRALRSAGSGVWIVPIGSSSTPPTLSIVRTTAPRVAFLEDTVPVQVVLQGDDIAQPSNITTRVLDSNGTTLATATTTMEGDQQSTVTIPVLPEFPGLTQWTLEVVADGRHIGTEPIQVDVRDRPLGLLLIEGTPRFLHRFVVPLLTRETTINASIVLQSAHPDAAPEGNTPIRRIPETATELEPFDLVVLGDVDPRSLTESQSDALRKHVLGGAGLLWIPGPKVQGTAWAGSSLEALLPVPPNTRRSIVRGEVDRTPEGVDLGLPEPPSLPLEWSLAVEQTHPLARPLMTTTTPDGKVWPTLLLLPTGNGRVGWLGSDDLWRWRRTSQPAQGDAVVMSIIRLLSRHVAPLEPMLRVLPDPIEGQSVSIVLEGDITDDPTEVEVDINDASGAPLQRVVLHRHGSQWRGLWRPTQAGTRTLEAQGVHLTVDVAALASEDMRLGVDMDSLAMLVTEAGGALVDPKDLDDLFEQVPHRARRTSRMIDEGPAGAWLLWSLLGVFLTLEWGLRRWNALA